MDQDIKNLQSLSLNERAPRDLPIGEAMNRNNNNHGEDKPPEEGDDDDDEGEEEEEDEEDHLSSSNNNTNINNNSELVAILSDKRRGHHRKDRPAMKWTKEEDELLHKAVVEHGARSWKTVASKVPNRDHTQCLQRWTKCLQPGLRKGTWTVDEDSILVQSVQSQLAQIQNTTLAAVDAATTTSSLLLVKRIAWAEVCNKIPGRTAKQCRERWVNNLDPAINKGPWTAQEDSLMVSLYMKYGPSWAAISKEIQGRTENAVKIRWKTVAKTRAGKEAISHSPYEKVLKTPPTSNNPLSTPAAAMNEVVKQSSAAPTMRPSKQQKVETDNFHYQHQTSSSSAQAYQKQQLQQQQEFPLQFPPFAYLPPPSSSLIPHLSAATVNGYHDTQYSGYYMNQHHHQQQQQPPLHPPPFGANPRFINNNNNTNHDLQATDEVRPRSSSGSSFISIMNESIASSTGLSAPVLLLKRRDSSGNSSGGSGALGQDEFLTAQGVNSSTKKKKKKMVSSSGGEFLMPTSSSVPSSSSSSSAHSSPLLNFNLFDSNRDSLLGLSQMPLIPLQPPPPTYYGGNPMFSQHQQQPFPPLPGGGGSNAISNPFLPIPSIFFPVTNPVFNPPPPQRPSKKAPASTLHASMGNGGNGAS